MRSRPIRALLAAAALAAALAGAAQARAQGVRMLVQNSPLAGFQYYAGAELWQQIRVGDALGLVREPDNTHDRNAVRVEWRGRKLGYLPRAENRAVAAELDRGTRLAARVSHLREERNPWRRIGIDIYAVWGQGE
jgi:hypothetical protein